MIAGRDDQPVLILDQGDGQLLRLDGGLVRRADWAGLPGHAAECGMLVVDFDRNSGLGRLTVQGESGFVPLGLRKRLEEIGDLDDSGQVLIYGRRRLEKYRFEVLHRVLPKMELTTLQARCEQVGLLLNDTFSLLYGLFQSLRPQEPTLLALRTSTGVSLLGGIGEDVLLLRRRSLADYGSGGTSSMSSANRDADLLADILTSAVRDLGGASGNRAGRVRGLWLEAAATSRNAPPVLADVAGAEFEIAPQTRLDYPESPDPEECEIHSALPWAVSLAGCSAALGPSGVRLRHGLVRAERCLWAFLGVAAAILLTLTLYFGYRTSQAASGIGHLESQVTELRQRRQALSGVAAQAERRLSIRSLNTALEAAADLLAASSGPTPAEILRDVAGCRPEGCRLDALELDFASSGVVLTLRGFMSGVPVRVGESMVRLLDGLHDRGWTVENRRLESGADGAFFVLGMRRASAPGEKS